MLDYRDRWGLEVIDSAQGGIRVHIVVVRHLLAVQLFGLGDTSTVPLDIERGNLVRVLPVAELLFELNLVAENGLEALARVLGTHADILSEPLGNRCVVGGGVGKSLAGQTLALRERRTAERDRLHYLRVAGRRGHNRDIGMVLGRGPHQSGATDVDLLDHGVRCRTGCYGGNERVEVRYNQLKRFDAEAGKFLLMGFEPQVSEQPGVDRRMQGAHAPVERLREPGDLADLGNRESGIRDRFRRRPGRHDLHPAGDERSREFDETRLIAHRNECSADRDRVAMAVGSGTCALMTHRALSL